MSSYRPLQTALSDTQHPHTSAIARQVNLYLSDVHTMFLAPQEDLGMDSGCNYSIALSLCAVIGGLSKTVYPISAPGGDFGTFTMLIRDWFKIYWGGDGWMQIGEAAELIYRLLRNPLTHDLGLNTPQHGHAPGRKVQSKQLTDSDVGKWGEFDPRDISQLERRRKWPNEVAIVAAEPNVHGAIPINLAGLYWATRQVAQDLFTDERTIQMAEHWHSFWTIHQELTPESFRGLGLVRVAREAWFNELLKDLDSVDDARMQREIRNWLAHGFRREEEPELAPSKEP